MAKTKQWDLSEEEAIQLQQRFYARLGTSRLLEALQRQLGEATIADSAWWDSVAINHKIPTENKDQLIACHETKKVWIKGECPDLDKRKKSYDSDNPNF